MCSSIKKMLLNCRGDLLRLINTKVIIYKQTKTCANPLKLIFKKISFKFCYITTFTELNYYLLLYIGQ